MTLVQITGSQETINTAYTKFFDQADKFFNINPNEEIEDSESIILEFDSLPIGAVAYINNAQNIEIIE